MPSLTPKRVLRESGSLGLILLLWGVVALVVGTGSTVRTGIQIAGLIMAGLYAILRGRALATEAGPVYERTDPESILRDNARALLPALAWFLLALLVGALEGLVFDRFDLIGVGSPNTAFVFAFVGTGVMTVLLYAVATGYASMGRGRSTRSFADD